MPVIVTQVYYTGIYWVISKNMLRFCSRRFSTCTRICRSNSLLNENVSKRWSSRSLRWVSMTMMRFSITWVLQDFPGVEQHRKTFATSLRVPDHARKTVAWIVRLEINPVDSYVD